VVLARCDVLIVGGGTAGCALASRLTEDDGRSVCLLEAGHDYGAFADRRWPADLLDARSGTNSHDWTDGEDTLAVAAVMGGCSAHNLCAVAFGAPGDYDRWASDTGDPGWSYAGLEPCLRRAETTLGARRFASAELGSWARAVIDAAVELGLPAVEDLNAPAVAEGAGSLPLNVRGSVRWNAAFAYLDPARPRPNLSIISDALVDRILLAGRRASGVSLRLGSERLTIRADVVVICAGAYSSPAILMRSGIGSEEELMRHGIKVVAPLPVGTRLRDHFGVPVRFELSAWAKRSLEHHRRRGLLFFSQALVKARSRRCDEHAWDLHLPASTVDADSGRTLPAGTDQLSLSCMLVQPRATGSVRLRSADPTRLPLVHEPTFDSADDLAVALDGIRLARRLAGSRAARDLIGEELAPGPTLASDADLTGFCRAHRIPYFHPTGTCRMGSDDDEEATVDSTGRVREFENLYVADASIMPSTPRANTHLTVLAIAERVAELLSLGRSPLQPARDTGRALAGPGDH
jgi:choline dehydrogenase